MLRRRYLSRLCDPLTITGCKRLSEVNRRSSFVFLPSQELAGEPLDTVRLAAGDILPWLLHIPSAAPSFHRKTRPERRAARWLRHKEEEGDAALWLQKRRPSARSRATERAAGHRRRTLGRVCGAGRPGHALIRRKAAHGVAGRGLCTPSKEPAEARPAGRPQGTLQSCLRALPRCLSAATVLILCVSSLRSRKPQ